MSFLLAFIPLALIIYLMIGRRWSAARAGIAGYLSALGIAVLFFGAGIRLLAYAQLEALILAADVLLIIWAAFIFYRVSDEAGVIRQISQALPHLTADSGFQALIIGWAFTSFLQGVGGFGVPVAVVAPILVGLGFSPLVAVVIPSIGHGWSVTFGSLGVSFQALLSATSLPAELIAPPTAALLGCACLLTGPLVAHAAGGWPAVRRLFGLAILLGVVMGGVQYLFVASGAWNIGGLSAGIAGLMVSIGIAGLRRRGDRLNRDLNWRPLLIALSGYAILVSLILGVQLIPNIKTWLNQIAFQIHFPDLSTFLDYVTPAHDSRRIPIFGHSGSLLLYSSILAWLVYRLAGLYQPGSISRILGGTAKRLGPSSLSIVAMVSMAVIMERSGMTETLAKGLADTVGVLFPAVSPWIGGLGAFITGSNTNSNVLFGALQMHTAERLAISVAIILAAQTAGAGLASIIAPTKVVVGTSTTGMSGSEGDVMRHLAGYVLLLILLISILAALGVFIKIQ
jgi:lactate permease